jgi:arylsulfatase A-like enzyme
MVSLIRIISFTIMLVFTSGCGTDPSGIRNRREATNNGKNVILIILDALRADHLSCYGYHRDTSPYIDSLSESGTLWMNTQSQAPWTLPSHASIWTGLSVKSHGTNFVQTVGFEGVELQLDTLLPSLPAVLQNADFQTAGFVNIVLISEKFGFNHGFDWYDCNDDGNRTAAATVDAFNKWLDSRDDPERFFCVIHLYDIHAPYNPAPPFDTAFSAEGTNGIIAWDGNITNDRALHLIDMYDSEILYTDNELGRLFSGLRQRGIADSTLIIVTSDHGDEFLDHGGIGHGCTLYQEVMHVPLIFSGPGIEQGIISRVPAALYDIMPTVISYLDIEVPEGVEGVDLLSQDHDQLRAIPSGGTNPQKAIVMHESISDLPTCAVVWGYEKVIAFMEEDRFIQFDLDEDPEEIAPCTADSIMTERALYYWATPPRGDPSPIVNRTRETLDILRDLGYVK